VDIMESFMSYIKGIAFLIILITFVVNALPDSSYKKYIKIFTSIVLVITILKPITDFLGIGDTFFNNYSKYSFEFDTEGFEDEINDFQNKIVNNYIDASDDSNFMENNDGE